MQNMNLSSWKSQPPKFLGLQGYLTVVSILQASKENHSIFHAIISRLYTILIYVLGMEEMLNSLSVKMKFNAKLDWRCSLKSLPIIEPSAQWLSLKWFDIST